MFLVPLMMGKNSLLERSLLLISIINSITVISAEDDEDKSTFIDDGSDDRLFRVGGAKTKPYTAKVKIDYTVNNGAFSSSDFIIINI